MARNDEPLKNSIYSDFARCYLQVSIGRGSASRSSQKSMFSIDSTLSESTGDCLADHTGSLCCKITLSVRRAVRAFKIFDVREGPAYSRWRRFLSRHWRLSLLQSQGGENDTCTAIPLEFNHDETDNYYQKFL